MRCPWYLFHRLFLVWGRTQGPHNPLLPGVPMSCQSAPGSNSRFLFSLGGLTIWKLGHCLRARGQ
ncbi:unnamed protein product [Staurois parvus]|uniref:Uncharacterized protein n=1 Tax=Staurois parvus TaxID=386267 RepID=A0ABN9EW99_9NEOB|nr:unnamed protein product [Staurois parvus]